jgi:hypothetical protein
MPTPPSRPGPDEYAPFFAGYVARVPEGDILAILEAQREATCALLAPLSREQVLARLLRGRIWRRTLKLPVVHRGWRSAQSGWSRLCLPPNPRSARPGAR